MFTWSHRECATVASSSPGGGEIKLCIANRPGAPVCLTGPVEWVILTEFHMRGPIYGPSQLG